MLLPWLVTSDQRRFAYAGVLAQLLMFVAAMALANEGLSYATTVIACAIAGTIAPSVFAKNTFALVTSIAFAFASYGVLILLAPLVGADAPSPSTAERLGDVLKAVMVIPAGCIALFLPTVYGRMLTPDEHPSVGESVEVSDGGGGELNHCVRPARIAYTIWAALGALCMPLAVANV